MEAPQKKVLVPIAYGSEEIEVVTLVDVFSPGGALVTVASVEKDIQIECSNGVKLVADTFISDCESQIFDLVVLPGGMPGLERIRDCKVLRNITEAHAKEGRLYGALSEAPAVVLETWGLLKGCQATCHPSFMDQLPSAVAVDASIQVDGMVTTSQRPRSTLDFALSIAELLFGKKILDEELLKLVGGMPGLERIRDCKVLRNITEAHAKEGRLYGALSEAPAVVLETWGLLKGCQATCHPSFMDQRPSAVSVDASIQVDGMVTTSQRPRSTLDFALSIAELLFGKKILDEELLKLMVPRGWNKCEVAKEEYNVDDWSLQNIPQVLVPIANRSDEMEIVVVVDVLRRAKANVVVASVEDSLEIVAARGTKIVADRLFKDAILSNYDLIHLPGGWYGAQKLGSTEQLIELLREHAESNKVYAAICASAVMLDTKGLLKGKKATTHPYYSNKLSDQSSVNIRVVIDGKVITSMSPGSTMEYALSIVEKFFGMEKANDIAEAMDFSYP